MRVAPPQLTIPLLLALAAPAGAQFSIDNSVLPGGSNNNSSTENVDFGDVDLDGDWDVALADGGDDGNDQNRLWINQGALQGGTLGDFSDETAARMPSILDDSRDIEFADIDDDGDLDMYTSNTSDKSNQTNRWLINLGLAQGGTLGYYQDETLSRWVGLGQTGSSIAPQFVLGGGGFVDWSCDCDFGDLDNDGDLDLVHSTYGGAFGGNAPTRIFLNDGGFFSEFNPSGHQLTTENLSNGQPAIWAEGTQQNNTSNSNGSNADVTGFALDIDVGDVNGDFDLDILHGSRETDPRLFENRLEETGSLGFRDVTNARFPSDWASGGGNYEQEMADFDGDGDLDIYGLNWNGFTDITMRNTGSGSFDQKTNLSGSGADDNEGDFLDYDNDGDLDLYVANFSGNDKLYRNNNNGGSTFSFTQVSLPSFSSTSLDADCCDTDGDGDYDVLVAEDNFAANTFLRNTTGTPDTHAPYIPNVESLGNAAAAAGERPVRAHVYDNAPYYITWYNPSALEVTVDGKRLPDIPMKSSAGQIFRGVLPANLLGSVTYTVRSADEYGNTGFSASEAYNSTGSDPTSLYGSGTTGSGGVPTIETLSLPLQGESLYIAVGGLQTNALTFLGVGLNQASPAIDLSNGLMLNVQLPLLLTRIAFADPSGDAVFRLAVPDGFGGITLHFQGAAFDTATPSGDDFASTRGLAVPIP